MIKITEKQMEMIRNIMEKYNYTQDEAVSYLITVGILEKQFRERYQ